MRKADGPFCKIGVQQPLTIDENGVPNEFLIIRIARAPSNITKASVCEEQNATKGEGAAIGNEHHALEREGANRASGMTPTIRTHTQPQRLWRTNTSARTKCKT